MALHDLTGMRYGRWTVIDLASCGKYVYWNCVCDCGVKRTVEANSLRRRISRGCGCKRNEMLVARSVVHGLSKLHWKEYVCWKTLKARCYNVNNAAYKNYGGRGIKMCKRWRDSFEAFFADMGPAPSEQYSIDRYPNNNGDYKPKNCRWATRIEQNNNRRNSIRYGGRKQSLAQHAADHGLTRSVVKDRIVAGWSLKTALETPIMR